MSASLESYVNRPVSVITADGRNFVGTLKVRRRESGARVEQLICRVLTKQST